MDLTVITAIIGVMAALSGMALGWSARNRDVKNEVKSEAQIETSLKTDMDYLKRGVDDIRFEQRAQRQQIDGLTGRLIKVEVKHDQLEKCVNDHIAQEGG
ncbi:MAG: hypothetical protein AB7E31_10550 [Desulfitobacterium sp.]